MKKNVIVFGLIAGAIVSAWLVGSLAYCYSTGKFEGSIVLGYTSMLIAFSMAFVGVKNYRDKYNNGVISFGKAFKMAFYITLLGSTIYVIVWLIDYYVFVPDFMEKYTAHAIKKAQDSGASATEIAEKTKTMARMQDLYKTPLGVILLTYLEILPMGIIVSLITALILKRKANSEGALAVN